MAHTLWHLFALAHTCFDALAVHPLARLHTARGFNWDGVAQLAGVEKQLAKAEAACAGVQARADGETAAHAALLAHVSRVESTAAAELRGHAASPPATMHALVATLRLLGKADAAFETWSRAARFFSEDELFADMAAYDAAAERDAAVWTRVRAAYKVVWGEGREAAEAKWAYEMPQTALGAVLMLFIKQARHPHYYLAVPRTVLQLIAGSLAAQRARTPALMAQAPPLHGCHISTSQLKACWRATQTQHMCS